MATPAPPYELLVFDWDGTLVDSIATIVACMHATTDELGLPRRPDEVVRGTIGLGLPETLDELFPEGEAELLARVVDCYRRRWLGGFAERGTLFPDARRVLEELDEEGYRMAVATGKSRRGLDLDLERTGLEELFLATRTADETAGKPSPRMVEEILEEMGVAPERALVIGDTIHDLRMAAAAGTPAVAVASGSVEAEELARHEPLAILPGVEALPAWLRRRGAGG